MSRVKREGGSYSIKEWPESDRPREKLLQRGSESLTDAELLAIVLRTGDGTSGRTALDHARSLMMAAMEICRRYATERLELGKNFNCSKEVFAHFHQRLQDKKKECFHILLMDSKNRVIKEVKVSEGTLTSSLVHPREVFISAVKEAAASLILVHNHPSGDPTPSREDEKITHRLVEGGKLLGLRVLDHIIVGQGRYFSFADQGRLR